MAILAAATRRHSLLHLLARRHHRSLSAAADTADDASPPPISAAATATATADDASPRPLSAAVAKKRLSREFDPDKVVSTFSAIASPSTSPISYSYALDLTVRRLALSRRTAEIITLIDSQKSSPLASQEPFLATLINAYGTAGMLNRAISLFEQVPTLCSAPPTVLSFNAVLSACMRAKRYSSVPAFFTELSTNHSIDPNFASYAMLIKSLCITGESAAALKKVSEMEGKSIKPTTPIYTILLSSLYKEGKLDEAEKIWTQMLGKGCQPDLAAYNIKASYLGQHGKPEELHAVIAEMESAGLKPDTATYNHLITSYCKSGRFEDAKGVYKEFYKTGCQRNAATFKNFMCLLCESGDLDGALGVFNDALKRKKIMPDKGATGLLMVKLVKESREEEAKAVLGEAKRKLPKELLGSWEKLEKKLSLVVEKEVSEKSEAA